MIWPIECDDAVDTTRDASTNIGYAIDALCEMVAPDPVVAAFRRAHDAVAYAVEQMSVIVEARRMEDVEVRHVESQLFPWTEEP